MPGLKFLKIQHANVSRTGRPLRPVQKYFLCSKVFFFKLLLVQRGKTFTPLMSVINACSEEVGLECVPSKADFSSQGSELSYTSHDACLKTHPNVPVIV